MNHTDGQSELKFTRPFLDFFFNRNISRHLSKASSPELEYWTDKGVCSLLFVSYYVYRIS